MGITSDGVMLFERTHHKSKPNCCPRFWEEVTEVNVHKWAGRHDEPGWEIEGWESSGGDSDGRPGRSEEVLIRSGKKIRDDYDSIK